MTNTELIAKIKVEIERLKDENRKIKCEANERYCSGYDDAFYDLVPFLDTLESEKLMNQNEELNEEIKRFVAEYDYEKSEDILLIAIVARHFAEWQKEQDEKELSDLLTIAHLQGAEQMKEQMLKEARECMVITNLANRPAIYLDQLKGFEYGDKVKIVIVKEDEK